MLESNKCFKFNLYTSIGVILGIWKLPWENKKIAQKFALRMKTPWIAKVFYEQEDDFGMYRWKAKDLAFMGGVYGADDLWDYLSEVSEKKKKDFDIRKCVKECLNYQIKHALKNLEEVKDIDAFNIVMTGLGKKPIRKAPIVKAIKLIKTDNKSNKYWYAKVLKNKLLIEFGRVGAKARGKSKDFSNNEKAILELNKLINQKYKKGYLLN